MKQLHITFLLIAGFFIHPSILYSQQRELSPKAKAIIDSTYNALIKNSKVEGLSLAIVDHGQIVYATGYGYADVKNKKKADATTIYRIGSCTKSFTCLSLMQLQEQQKLNVNSPVSTYLTELAIKSRFNDNNQLPIRDLMSHVSGLPCDVINGFFCDSPPDIKWLIQELNKQYTIFPSRYVHAYSNVAFGLLGETIARVSGTSYSNYVKQHIFTPLGMQHSFIEYDSLLAKDYAKGYLSGKESIDPMIRDQAAGLIHSNVLDMSNYLMMYLNKGSFQNQSIVNVVSIDEMEKNQISDIELAKKESWGYGLYTSNLILKKGKDSTYSKMIGHGGDTYLYHADFKYIPELQIGAVLMTNSSNGGGLVSASRLLKIYLKQMDSVTMVTNPKMPNTKMDFHDSDPLKNENTYKGSYNLGDFIIDVKDVNKITFHQGPAKVIFTKRDDTSGYYKAKARLFYVIPFKIDNQEFKFIKHKELTYLKVRFKPSMDEDYMGTLLPGSNGTINWKGHCGKYVSASYIFPCKNCGFMNLEGATVKLKEVNGVIKMEFKGKTADMNSTMYLDLIDDKLAFTGGIGRGKGETVRFLDNGNLYYAGMEFKKE